MHVGPARPGRTALPRLRRKPDAQSNASGHGSPDRSRGGNPSQKITRPRYPRQNPGTQALGDPHVLNDGLIRPAPQESAHEQPSPRSSGTRRLDRPGALRHRRRGGGPAGIDPRQAHPRPGPHARDRPPRATGSSPPPWPCATASYAAAPERTCRTKRVYYLSLEFLIGRLLLRRAEQSRPDRDHARRRWPSSASIWTSCATIEPDAALGNGGLGRLAACFMESMATLGDRRPTATASATTTACSAR